MWFTPDYILAVILRKTYQETLSFEKLNELSSILRSFPSKRAMPFEALDGFFTALICCPHIVPQNKYMYMIYGNDDPEDASPFKSIKQFERFFGLLMKYWNNLIDRLQCAVFEPFLEVVGDHWENYARAWADGFLMGSSLTDGAFKRVIKGKHESALFMPIFALAHNENFSDKNVIQEEMTPELRKELVSILSNSIPVIYAILRDPDFEEKSKKINKNDTCSCDSKKKYIKCKTNRTLH